MIPREQLLYDATRTGRSPSRVLYPGDGLDVQRAGAAGEVACVTERGAHSVIATLDLPTTVDLETYEAKVGAPGPLGLHATGTEFVVRLVPFQLQECGCVLNHGGYHVRRCDEHPLIDVEVEVEEALAERDREAQAAWEGRG